MDFRVKSAVTVFLILMIMVTTGVLVNYFQGGITGAISTGIACQNNADCDDHVGCTIDSCKNPGGETSFCSNVPIDYCLDNDGCCPSGCTEINDNDC